jgi:histidyl-tRNA synthetase
MKDMTTLKGFRDFLPSKMAIRNEAIKRLRTVFAKYGFEELQTPAVEYAEVLKGKYGEEAEKLMYLFKDPGERNVGLRYDLTVPLARVISSYPDLPKPFKRFQIQPAYRAENTQKGRYREFYQCDVDIVGSSSPISDAEILAVTNDSLKALGFTSFKIMVNSRSILYSLMEASGIPDTKYLTIAQSLDKLEKKGKEEVVKELSAKGFDDNTIKTIFENISKAAPDKYLSEVLEIAKKMGVAENIVFEPTLSRGLDYYTGPIFESVVTEPKIGSITGGGRYDKLLKTLGGPDLPAVGTTIGLDRVCDVIEELNLWPNITRTSTNVLVTIFSNELKGKAIDVAQMLRAENINTELYPSEDSDLNKQLKFADKKEIPFAIIIGPDEAKNDSVMVKNLATGKQETVSLQDLVTYEF